MENTHSSRQPFAGPAPARTATAFRRFALPSWLLLLFLLLGTLFSPPARAEQFGDFTYTIEGSDISSYSVIITNYTGEGGAVTVPDAIADLPVKRIGPGAFANKTSLASVVIPGSVTAISYDVFQNCTGLASITMPDSITEIGDRTFHNCTSLASAAIPNGVISIEGSLFLGCTGLVSVTMPDNVTKIGSEAFSGCTSLASVTIPSSVTFIEDDAFFGCIALVSVGIPANVASIGTMSFDGCTGLLSIDTAEDNRSYSSVGGVLFDKSRSRLMRYPAGRTGEYVIPGNVVAIEDYAFSRCAGLSSVAIPSSVTSIRTTAFTNCTNLASIDVAADNAKYASVEGVLFNKDRVKLIECPEGKTGDYVIPGSVTIIEGLAFGSCAGLTSVVIPNSVTSIGRSAFRACTGLTRMAIPDSVTSIEIGLVSSCTGLTGIDVADGNTKYASVEGVLFDKDRDKLIVFPEGKIGGYVIPDKVTTIGMYAFHYCAGLSSVIMPDSVTTIESAAFQGCTGLSKITVSNRLTSIGSSAFRGCIGLTRIVLPGSVTSIQAGAFSDCAHLTSATFEGNAPTSVGWYIFDNPAPGFTVYYYQGSTGFTSPEWQGYPAVMLTAPAVPTLEEWRKLHFGEGATNSGAAADDADPDGDGLANIEEYAAGTDPKNAASQFRVLEVARLSSLCTITFEAQPSRRYELQRLVPGSGVTWQTVDTLPPQATAGPASLTDFQASAAAALYRIKATPAP